MKKLIKFLIALIFGSVIFYLVIQRAGVETLQEAGRLFFSLKGGLVILTTLLIAAVGILRWKVVLGCQGEKRKFSELIGVWTVGYSIDYLTPVSLFGGEALRAYLTGKTLDIDWEKSFSSVIIDKILDGTFHIIFIIVGVSIFLSYGSFPEVWIFWLVVLAIFGLSIILALFYSRAIGKKSITLLFFKILGLNKTDIKATKSGEFIFNTEGNVLRFFSPSQSFFWKGIVLSLLRHLLFYTRALILVYILVGSIEPLKSVAIQGLSFLALFLPLPAGLGGLEAVSAFGFETLGFGFEQGTVFGMNWRAADLVLCLFGVIFGVKIFLITFKLKIFDFIDRVKEVKVD